MMTPNPPKAGKPDKAFLLADRIDTSNLQHDGVVSTAPLTYRFGKEGLRDAVRLRRGGHDVPFTVRGRRSSEYSADTPDPVRWRHSEEETSLLEVAPDKDDQILPGGPMILKTSTPDHLIVIADALSKSVVLARDEREVAAVFEVIEPFARQLAEKGRAAAGRRAILKHIGNALLVQHRVSGRVAVAEKPDVVWDRQDLERLTLGCRTNTSLRSVRKRCRGSSW